MSWLLTLHQHEYKPRIHQIAKELSEWKKRVQDDPNFQIHQSQIETIDIIVCHYQQQQERLLQQLIIATKGDYSAYALINESLLSSLIEAHRFWNFFRQKFELRFSPNFQEILWLADTVAWDGYKSVLDMAKSWNIVCQDNLREPPLTYINSEFCASTYVRGSRPFDGRDYEHGESYLPIPVIEIPAYHLCNIWALITICHEVGHDIEVDLNLRQTLKESLKAHLSDAKVPLERKTRWMKWLYEIFADFVALQLMGPWFTDALVRLLLLNPETVLKYNDDDVHPTHHLRILLNAKYIRTLDPENERLNQNSESVEYQWKSLYDTNAFDDFVADFPIVISAIMDSRFAILKNVTVRELMKYDITDDSRIRALSEYLLNGGIKPISVKPRHCLSAAMMAVNQLAEEGKFNKLSGIDKVVREIIRAYTPGGTRSYQTSDAHKKFIESFLDKHPFGKVILK